jgi:fructuronate reductase
MKIKILHLGLGRFHKAHQAVYYQKLFEEHGEEWGVAAFSMRSPEASDRLRAVQQTFPVVELGFDQARVRWINCIKESYFAARDQEQLKYYFCSPDVALITLTVTEKAYTQNILDEKSVIAVLFSGLKNRMKSNAGKVTVLSCDNLRNNGLKLKNAVVEYGGHAADSETLQWINENVKFPNSMVDRIVPALTDKRLQELQHRFAIQNSELTATEFFSQWVIENDFNLPFPPLQKTGAQLVTDVVPYEEIKLFLLNASHSFLAYAGILKSYSYVHEAVNDPELSAELRELHDEILPLLKIPEGFDIQAYKKQMLERFNNPELPHQLRQIAMDGSQKLHQRIFPTLKKALQRGLPKKQLQACVEFWVKYCFTHVPDDPLKDRIEQIKSQSADLADFRKRLSSIIES